MGGYPDNNEDTNEDKEPVKEKEWKHIGKMWIRERWGRTADEKKEDKNEG